MPREISTMTINNVVGCLQLAFGVPISAASRDQLRTELANIVAASDDSDWQLLDALATNFVRMTDAQGNPAKLEQLQEKMREDLQKRFSQTTGKQSDRVAQALERALHAPSPSHVSHDLPPGYANTSESNKPVLPEDAKGMKEAFMYLIKAALSNESLISGADDSPIALTGSIEDMLFEIAGRSEANLKNYAASHPNERDKIQRLAAKFRDDQNMASNIAKMISDVNANTINNIR